MKVLTITIETDAGISKQNLTQLGVDAVDRILESLLNPIGMGL